MNINKYYIAFFLCILSQIGFSQNAKISLTSNSGKLFLMMNNIIQNNQPKDSLHIQNIDEGSYSIKIIDVNNLTSAEKTIYINNDQHQQYEYYVEDSIAFIRLIGNYTENIPDSLFINHSINEKLPIDSLYKHTSDSLKLNSLLYPTNYSGKTGCNLPSFINTQLITQKIENQLLTSKKKTLILNELKGKCIQVSDLKLILKTIDYEDTKLNIIKLLSTQIYDLGNLNELNNLFNIRGYQDAFNEFKSTL